MIPEQLSLFGSPRPPKKIKEDEDIIPALPEQPETPVMPEIPMESTGASGPPLPASEPPAGPSADTPEATLEVLEPEKEPGTDPVNYPDAGPDLASVEETYKEPVGEADEEPAGLADKEPELANETEPVTVFDTAPASEFRLEPEEVAALGSDELPEPETEGVPESAPLEWTEEQEALVSVVLPQGNDQENQGAEEHGAASDVPGEEMSANQETRGRIPIQEFSEKPGQLKIPPDEELFKRQYYSMRETAAMFDVSHSLLRFWENEFDILQPKKNKKGDRYFRPLDVKNLQLIYHLLRVRKFTIEGAKEFLRNRNKALDTFEMINKLEKLKSFLHELKAHL